MACACGLRTMIRSGLATFLTVALAAGCDSGGPTFSGARSGSETAVAAPPAKRTMAEKRTAPRGSNKAASAARPTGAE
jgi:hypothetical protein